MFFKDRPPIQKMQIISTTLWIVIIVGGWVIPSEAFNQWGWLGYQWLGVTSYITMALVRLGMFQ